MTPLGREIAAMIAADGPMRLDRYMALCLGHPSHGYYATRDPFGARGDFVTAPEISQMFGELIGLWCAEVWRMMGEPSRVRLVELGPGRGTLMADLLRAAKAAPGFRDAIEVVLVETSPALREVQARTFAPSGAQVDWAGTVEEALSLSRLPGRSETKSRDRAQDEAQHPSPGTGEGGPAPAGSGGVGLKVALDDQDPTRHAAPRRATLPAAARRDNPPVLVVANEFFDALPIRQFVATSQGWRERLVGLDRAGALAFGLAPDAPTDIRLPGASTGATRELCADALDIAARLAGHLAAHGGAMLAIDYGYLLGAGDTLQAMRAHAFADPLADPGEADLTAHVDFAALGTAARRGGAFVMAPLTQAELLDRLALSARAEALSRARPDQREAIGAAAARLTDRSPRGMGALFKALAFGDPRLGPLPGFAPSTTHDIQGTEP